MTNVNQPSILRGQNGDSRVAIKATKIAMTVKNIGTYLIICEGCQFYARVCALILTMARRFFLILMLKMGACICFDGHNQTAREQLS